MLRIVAAAPRLSPGNRTSFSYRCDHQSSTVGLVRRLVHSSFGGRVVNWYLEPDGCNLPMGLGLA